LPYEIKKEKKKSPGKESETPAGSIEGSWAYTIEIPEQDREGTFEFSNVNGEWKGTITSTEITSGNAELKDIVVDGNKVSFAFDLDMGGQEVELEFDLTLKGDSMGGSVSVGPHGSFTVTSTRTTKPN